ncbi:hypothetical protein ACJMK2_034752 [Sinanodonta woodiana]|uniref:beta-N-acetylhexosaminidase n=1 Tax=Sinanodonta woodiana TaxID=1069815 RepID=A0ABD3WW54_SINWO
MNHIMTENHRIVHLDLKGAPPKVEYYEQIFPLFKKFGATGLLLEYEDMFPYKRELAELANPFAYSKEGIAEILELAKNNGLIVIPLVQSFGHFEFVLKHEKFHSLREVPDYPMALCPSNPDSILAVTMMIDQVMDLHSGIKWFHIGADEVYHIGICERCKKRMGTEALTTQQLFFAHIRAVLMHIKKNYPSVIPIMWDDMMRCVELPILLESGLRDLVEPMVWHYLTSFVLPPDWWDRLSRVFPNIWVASAFKGATGSCVYTTNIMYHIDNQMAWLSVIEREKAKFKKIRGVALTGWQRYDHYAVLCELLPHAIPSLAVCLAVLNRGTFNADIHMDVTKQLQFHTTLPLNPFQCHEIPKCNFPGSSIYEGMFELLHLDAVYEDFLHSESRLTWLNDYFVKRNFTNPTHLEAILAQALKIHGNLRQLQAKLQQSLSQIYYVNTVEEWLGVFLNSKVDKMAGLIDDVKNQLKLGGTASRVKYMQLS